MTTTPATDDHRRRVILTTGDELTVSHDDHRGVHTDAGCHPWDQVEAFIVWHKARRKWYTVPVN